MKKMLFGWVVAGLVVFGANAAEKVRWPVWFAFNDSDNVDVVGLRLTLPWGQCEQVSGLDVGFVGRSTYFSGIQINVLRNDVKDTLQGWQIGCYNSAGLSDAFGIQTGLWNEAKTISGIQAGLINLADYSKGFQIGIINRVEGMNGYQVGLINIIRDSRVPFMPLINFSM
ncbi:MAG: hypothetical protein WCK89_13400 [bacterium]